MKNLKVKAYLINCLLSVTIRRHKNWIQIEFSFVRLGWHFERGKTWSDDFKATSTKNNFFNPKTGNTLLKKISALGDQKFWNERVRAPGGDRRNLRRCFFGFGFSLFRRKVGLGLGLGLGAEAEAVFEALLPRPQLLLMLLLRSDFEKKNLGF